MLAIMAPTTRHEFADDTAFERFVLDRAIPLAPPNAGSTVIDLRGSILAVNATPQPATVAVGVTDTFGGGSTLMDDLRPLLFGSAWKVLDLLVELAMSEAGLAPNKQGRYRIEDKVQECRSGLAPLAEFSASTNGWDALMASYAATDALRHTMVHRQALVGGDGSLTATEAGQPIGAPLTAAEQEAFCRATQRASDAVITGSLGQRSASDIAYHLNTLARHHGLGALPAVQAPQRVVSVLVTPELVSQNPTRLRLDVDAARQVALRVVGGVPFHDLEIHLDDGRVLEGHLEDAGTGALEIDPLALPDWLCWR